VRREEFDGVRPGEEKQELDYGRRMASAWLRRRTAGSELRRRTATPATSGTSDERGELERERRVRVGGRRERALLSPFIESRREKKSLPERRQWLAGLQVPSMASVTSQGINGESNGEEETVGVMILTQQVIERTRTSSRGLGRAVGLAAPRVGVVSGAVVATWSVGLARTLGEAGLAAAWHARQGARRGSVGRVRGASGRLRARVLGVRGDRLGWRAGWARSARQLQGTAWRLGVRDSCRERESREEGDKGEKRESGEGERGVQGWWRRPGMQGVRAAVA
jgi:hypothetical protein